MLFEIVLTVDPYMPDGWTWLQNARDIINVYCDPVGLVVGLPSGGAYMIDTVNDVYDRLPVAIGVTAGVVFVMMAIAFRSIVIPIRSIFTIVLTLSFVYGASTQVYEYGIFNFMGFWGLHGTGW